MNFVDTSGNAKPDVRLVDSAAHEIVFCFFSSTSWSHRAQEMRSQTFHLLTPQPVGRDRTFDGD